jgi:RNA polymerase sigma-70 factor, ECF subfamily
MQEVDETNPLANLVGQSARGINRYGTAIVRELRGPAPLLDSAETSLLENYVTHSVARDFDKLRELLAQDVRLDVVGISQSSGAAQVGGYFHRYSGIATGILK